MIRRSRAGRPSIAAPVVLVVLLFGGASQATASFARQTGFSCSQCHTQFPELTSFGRAFKAGGYTMSLTPSVTEQRGKETVLDLLRTVPLGLMTQVAFTHTSKSQVTPGAPAPFNDDVQLPQQLSLFYAGKVAPNLGAFIQVTYDGTEDHLGLDNTDIRYARTFSVGDKGLVCGLTLNNNPTVQDLWNTTPAWSFPWAAPDVAPSPAASPILAGALAQSVAGLGVYAFYDGLVYGELSIYHSAPLGVTRPLGAGSGPSGTGTDVADVISGVAPYWRLAVEKDLARHAISVGSFGMVARLYPGAAEGLALGGAVDRYVDAGFDAQYQYVGDRHIVTGGATYIHEWQSLDASFGAGAADRITHSLDSLQVSAGYLWERALGLRLGYFTTSGTSDALLYAPAGISGSRTGSPDSNGLIAELSYLPWLNTKLTLQETAYFTFNGAGSNYDGSGRDASANNTLFLLAWLAF